MTPDHLPPVDASVPAAVTQFTEHASHRDRLVMLASEHGELWRDSHGTAFITVPVGDHHENHPVLAEEFKGWLFKKYRGTHGGAPSILALRDAVHELAARAKFEHPKFETFVRVADRGDHIYIDLGDPTWRAIQVRPRDWSIIDHPPVKFVRTARMEALPEPMRGGNIQELRSFLNVAELSDFQLIVGCLIGALWPKGPYPILVLNGEQGTAKSTTARVIRELVDPNAVALRGIPRDGRDLVAAARNNWMVAFDNVSGIPPSLADEICRLATGGGLGGRALYTDHDEATFEAQRPVLLNGIPSLADRGDLADRCVVITLPRIDDNRRRTEEEFWAKWGEAKPRILGALLEVLVCALRRIKSVRLDRKPRMADFALRVTAAEPALGWPDGAFLKAFERNRDSAMSEVIEASPVAQAVIAFVSATGSWHGTATDLLGSLGAPTHKDRNWPTTAARLGAELRRFSPAMRQEGISVEFAKAPDRSRQRIVRLRCLRTHSEARERTVSRAPRSSKRPSDVATARRRSTTVEAKARRSSGRNR